jgi:molecular chaperone DnaK
MDADGILEVSAVEVATGRASTVTIEASSGLTHEEIQQLQARQSARPGM